jgi:hypothetical protein
MEGVVVEAMPEVLLGMAVAGLEVVSGVLVVMGEVVVVVVAGALVAVEGVAVEAVVGIWVVMDGVDMELAGALVVIDGLEVAAISSVIPGMSVVPAIPVISVLPAGPVMPGTREEVAVVGERTGAAVERGAEMPMGATLATCASSSEGARMGSVLLRGLAASPRMGRVEEAIGAGPVEPVELLGAMAFRGIACRCSVGAVSPSMTVGFVLVSLSGASWAVESVAFMPSAVAAAVAAAMAALEMVSWIAVAVLVVVAVVLLRLVCSPIPVPVGPA